MQDIIYVGTSIAFFALCVAYVHGLDRLVRGGEDGERPGDLIECDDIASEHADLRP